MAFNKDGLQISPGVPPVGEAERVAGTHTHLLPRLEDWGEGEEVVLLCGNCGDEYLHQLSIEVYPRHEDEDGVDGVDIDFYTGETTRVDARLNPSMRRQGLRIAFGCEGCGGVDEEHKFIPVCYLTIFQHKGNTFVEWEVGGDAAGG